MGRGWQGKKHCTTVIITLKNLPELPEHSARDPLRILPARTIRARAWETESLERGGFSSLGGLARQISGLKHTKGTSS